MSESDDICKQLPAITLEDALKKKEVEDGNKAPLEDALKKKKEVEDGNQVPLEDALKKKVEDGNQVPPLDDELKKEKVELDDTCRKLKEKVEDGSGKLELKRKKMMKAKNKKKKQEVEDGTQAPVADLLKKEVEDDLRKLLKLKMMKAKKHEVEEEDWRKYLGVLKSAGMFSASVRNPPSLGGHRVWLGTYKSPKVAALAYDRAAYKLHGSQATLNFPDQIRTPSDDHAPNNNNNN